METSSDKAGQHKTAQHTSGLNSGAAVQYTITNQELCFGKLSRWSVNTVPEVVFIPLHCACCALTYHNTVNGGKTPDDPGKTPDAVILDTDVSPVPQKNYDLMGDLLEVDILILFRQVLREEESLVKVGGQPQFDYFPRMPLTKSYVITLKCKFKKPPSWMRNTKSRI